MGNHPAFFSQPRRVTEGWFHRSSILETHCFSTFSIFCTNIYRCVSFLLAFLSCSSTQIFLKDFLYLQALNPCGKIFFTLEGWQSQKNCKTSYLLRIPRPGGSWRIGQDFGKLSFSVRRFLFLEHKNHPSRHGGINSI